MDSYESDHRATDHSSISLHSNTTSDISPLLQNTRAQSSSTASRGPVIEVEDDAENHIVYGKSNEPSATIASSVINLANTILGAGMLAMPAAVASVGLGFGILLILFSGCCSGFGLFLLSRSATRTIGRHASFFSVAQLTYAKAAMVIDLAIAIKCFGVGVSYLIIIGDLMPEVMTGVGIEGDGILHSRSFWITVFMLIIIPLSFLKRLDSLRYTSMAALGAVVYLFGIVVYFYFFPSVDSNVDEVIRPTSPPITWFRFSKRFFTSLPIFVFAFTCHQNIFTVYNELADNAQKNVSAVIYRSVGAALFIYESIGILGYLSFGDDVLPNIILMYNNGTVVTAGRAAIVILQLFSFPLQCHPCRASLDKVWAGKSISHTLVPTSEEEANARAHHDSTNLQGLEEQVTVTEDSEFDEPAVNVPPPAPILTTDQRFFLLTSGILIASYILAISIQELDLVLSLVGSTGSTTISFILPGIFYWKLTEPAPGRRDYRRSLKQRVLRWSAGALAVYGVCIMIICLTFNLQRAFSSP